MSYAAALRSAARRKLRDRPRRFVLPALFAILVLPVLLCSALLVPPGEVPDEVAHVVRADSLLHGVVVGHRVAVTDAIGNPAQDAVVTANPALLTAGFALLPGTPKQLTRARLGELAATPWAPALAEISVPNTAVYMPLFYVPAAFGLGAGHLLGLAPYHSILAARLCSGAVFAAIALLALLLARRAQDVLFGTLALPMTVSLAASCNQDGLLIATACLVAALWTRPTFGAWGGGIAALGLVLATKPLYLPLAGLAALAAPVRGFRPGLRGAGLGLTMLPALLWYALAQRHAMVPFLQTAAYAAGPLWPGSPGERFAAWDPALQLRVVRQHPGLLFALPWRLLRDDYEALRTGLVGVLGTLDVLLPAWMYTAWYWALGALGLGALLGGSREAPGPAPWATALGLLCVGAAALMVMDGSYLSFSPIGADRIHGVQGRYALLLLPTIGWALPTVRAPAAEIVRRALLAPAVLAAAAGLLVVPRLLVFTYYLR